MGVTLMLLQGTKFGRASRAEMSGVFTFLEYCLEQIVKDNELGALQQVHLATCCLPSLSALWG